MLTRRRTQKKRFVKEAKSEPVRRSRLRRHVDGSVPYNIANQCGNCGMELESELRLTGKLHTFKTRMYQRDPLEIDPLRAEVAILTVAEALSVVFKIDLGEDFHEETGICNPCFDILKNLHIIWNSFLAKTVDTSILHSFLTGEDGRRVLMAHVEVPSRKKLKGKICRRSLTTSSKTDDFEYREDFGPAGQSQPSQPVNGNKPGIPFEKKVSSRNQTECGEDDGVDALNFVEADFGTHDGDICSIPERETEFESTPMRKKLKQSRKKKSSEDQDTAELVTPGSMDTATDEVNVTKRSFRASTRRLTLLPNAFAVAPTAEKKTEETNHDGSDFEPGNLEETQVSLEKNEMKKSRRRKRIRRNQKSEGTETCMECRSRFLTKAGLQHHHRQIHSDIRGPFICDIEDCGKVFPGYTAFEIHRNTHLGIRPYICDQCGWATTGEKLLRFHLETHLKPEERELLKCKICETCGAKFRNASGLKMHRLVHSDERPFRCTFQGCESKFKIKAKLMLHKKEVHLDIGPSYDCNRCGRKFNRKHNWKQHVERHEKYDSIGTAMRKSRDPPIKKKVSSNTVE